METLEDPKNGGRKQGEISNVTTLIEFQTYSKSSTCLYLWTMGAYLLKLRLSM